MFNIYTASKFTVSITFALRLVVTNELIMQIFLISFLLTKLLWVQAIGKSMKCFSIINDQICSFGLGPTDFYLAFDSNGNKSDVFRPFAHSIFYQLFVEKPFESHRLSIFEATAGKADLLVDRCKRRPDFHKMNLSTWRPNLTTTSITGVFEMLDQQMSACVRGDYQSIALVFIYGYSTQEQTRDYLNDFKRSTKRSNQIYIIYSAEEYKKGNVYENLLEDDLIHGCYFYLPSNDKSEIDRIAFRLMKCICYRSEDCNVHNPRKLGKCSFVVENGTEQCVARFGGTTLFQPTQKLRPYARPCNYTKKCNESEIQECIDDCASKKWSEWSQCSFNAEKNSHHRQRQRMPNDQSFGQFSNKSCPKWQEESCVITTTVTTPSTTASRTTVMVHIIDITTPVSDQFNIIYIFVVVGCTILTVFVILAVICILMHNKRKTTTTTTTIVFARKQPAKSVFKSKKSFRAASTSARSQALQSGADGSLQLVGDESATSDLRKSRTANEKSQKKMTLPTQSEDPKSSKYRSSRLMSAKSRKSDKSRSRKTPRKIKHIENYVKLTPKSRKKKV